MMSEEGLPRTKVLIIVLALLIVFIYLRYYSSYNPSFDVIQLSVSDLEVKHLLEKSPIVINESIVDPYSIVHTAFRYLYIYKHMEHIPENTIKKNKSRYLILYSKSNSTIVDVIHPKTMELHCKNSNFTSIDDVPFVQFYLRDAKCMILPSKWFFRIKNSSDTLGIYLEDLISMTIGKTFS